MRDVNINALNFLGLNDFRIATNDKIAPLIVETFFENFLVVQIAQMTLLASNHDGDIHERDFALFGWRFRKNVLTCKIQRVQSGVAHLENLLINVHKDVRNVGQSACTCFRRQQRFIGKNSEIFGRRNGRAIHFLHQGLVHRHIAKLDTMFGLGFIADDFNL